jgi:methyl-galactoside transport system ATP-binding protein
MVSSELEELLGICDRIIVLSGGNKTGEVDPHKTTQEEIMALAAQCV